MCRLGVYFYDLFTNGVIKLKNIKRKLLKTSASEKKLRKDILK